MDKLFDLMVMGAKYQLACCTSLGELLQVHRQQEGTCIHRGSGMMRIQTAAQPDQAHRVCARSFHTHLPVWLVRLWQSSTQAMYTFACRVAGWIGSWGPSIDSTAVALRCAATAQLSIPQVTHRHLQNVKQMVAAGSGLASLDMVAHAEGLARTFYGRLSDGQLSLMRQTLHRRARAPRDGAARGGGGGVLPLHRLLLTDACYQRALTSGAALRPPPTPASPAAAAPSKRRFFQDKRVRVSLFLAEGIQAPNGRLILPSCLHNRAAAASDGGAAPGPGSSTRSSGAGGCAGDVPLGRVRVFDASGSLAWEGRRPLAVLQVCGATCGGRAGAGGAHMHGSISSGHAFFERHASRAQSK
jgi:hypothetical protein